jgi:hypothetical protein
VFTSSLDQTVRRTQEVVHGLDRLLVELEDLAGELQRDQS